MMRYIARRLLLMVPTLFAIVMIIFVMVNVAPGTPGQALSSGGGERADQSANAREGYRLFKEQYNLDKPVLFNTRFLISTGRVQRELEVLAANMSRPLPGEDVARHVADTVADVLTSLVNAELLAILAEAEREEDEDRRGELLASAGGRTLVEVPSPRAPRPEQRLVFRAENRVEDWGQSIVPQLLEIAHGYLAWVSPEGERRAFVHDDRQAATRATSTPPAPGWRPDPIMTERVRHLAIQRLSVNAQRRLVVRDGERADERRIALNREIRAENQLVRGWVWEPGAPAATQADVLERWDAWYAEHSARYRRTVGRAVRDFFFDTRFAHYMGNLMPIEFRPRLRLRAPDLGTSMRFRRPVTEVIGQHWRYSVLLSVISLILSYLIAVPLGVMAAVRQNGIVWDRGVGILLFVLFSLPSFFAATVVQTYLTAAKGWDIFPVSGFDSGRALEMTTLDHTWDVILHLVLPVACLTYGSLAVLSRYARTGLLDVIRSDYIRTARAKGVPEWMVVMRHAVRNGMIPILTLLGSTLPYLIGGSIIIEYIFVIDGMGQLMLQSIMQRDYNVIMGILLLSSVLTLIGLLLSDISYALADPRIDFD